MAGGAKLFEMRHDPSAAVRSWVDVDPVVCKEVALHMKAVVGDRERESDSVSVRHRRQADLGSMTIEAFSTKIAAEIASKAMD